VRAGAAQPLDQPIELRVGVELDLDRATAQAFVDPDARAEPARQLTDDLAKEQVDRFLRGEVER